MNRNKNFRIVAQRMIDGGFVRPITKAKAKNLLKAEKLPTGITELDDKLRGGIYRGGVTLVCGESHEGKTGLICQIIAKTLATTDKPVIAYSREMSDGELINKAMFMMAGSELVKISGTNDYGIPTGVERDIRRMISTRYLSINTIVDNKTVPAAQRWKRLQETLETLVSACGGDCLVVIDPLMMLTSDTAFSPDLPRDEIERQVCLTSWLEDFAITHNTWVLIAAHFRKKSGNFWLDDTPDRILGASAVVNAAGTIITYCRYTDHDFKWIRENDATALASYQFSELVKEKITKSDKPSEHPVEDAEKLIQLLDSCRKIKIWKNRGNRGKLERIGYCAGFDKKTERIGSYGYGDFADSEYAWRKNFAEDDDLADPIDSETGMTFSEIQRKIDTVILPALEAGDKAADAEYARLMAAAERLNAFTRWEYET